MRSSSDSTFQGSSFFGSFRDFVSKRRFIPPHIRKTKLLNSFTIQQCKFIVLRPMENSGIPAYQFHFTSLKTFSPIQMTGTESSGPPLRRGAGSKSLTFCMKFLFIRMCS